MSYHTIQISDDAYALLLRHAEHFQITPDQILKRLMADSLAILDAEGTSEDETQAFPSDQAQALAAVRRLSTLFSDLVLPEIDQLLHDPFLTLANIDLLEPIA